MRTINFSTTYSHRWLRHFPDGIPEWGDWRFIFNAENEDYDYLVAYDETHNVIEPRCPHENIIHLCTEPPSWRLYDRDFLSQYAWIVTNDKRVRHLGAIYHHGGLAWYLGAKRSDWQLPNLRPEGWIASEEEHAKEMSFNRLRALFDKPKSKLISIVAAKKTLTQEHRDRTRFALRLKEYYGDRLDFYGDGFFDMHDKLESLKDYRFQIVIENSVHDHYFTEKITDCVIAGTYPLYHGCPNLDLYFPCNSYMPINLYDFNEAVRIIDYALAEELDVKYRPALLEARNDALYKHNVFPMIIRLIEDIERGIYGLPNPISLYKGKILPMKDERFRPFYLQKK